MGVISFGQKPKPSPAPEGGVMRLTRTESITDALSTKHYFYLKEEGFRIQMPGNVSNYVPSKPASVSGAGTDGQVSWNLPEADLDIIFGDMDSKLVDNLTPGQKQQVLLASLNVLANKEGIIKISERDITVSGVPTKEIKYKHGEQEYLARDLFLGSRLFVFIACLHNVDNAESLVKHALDTFEAVKPPASEPLAVIESSGELVEDGIFRSINGGFSIAIPELPKQTLDKATVKAKAKGVDVGKQFIWLFERTLYTIYYNPPVDVDGNPYPPVYADMGMGSRKGILNGNATLISEKPIKLGKNRGTEFRYVISNGVRYVGRIYLVGDVGYQVVGGYADAKDEKKVLEVLDSFKLLKAKP